MAQLKLIKGGKEEDSNTSDYQSVITMGLLIGLFVGGMWGMKFCFDTVLDNPDSIIEAGNKMLTGTSIAMLSLIGIALGKEMTSSPNRYTSMFGIAVFCFFIGLFLYGGYHMTFK